MIVGFIQQLGPWSWFVGGLFLLALEIAAPGAFFLWFGIAAILVGIIDLIFGLSWQVLVSLFLILAIVLLVFGRRYFAARMAGPVGVRLNARGERLIGHEAVLDEPIVEGRGRIRVDDTTWRVSGADLPTGAHVRVVAVDGALLKVEQIRPIV